MECFSKPIWTLDALAKESVALPPHLFRVALSGVGWPISNALRERIMLAVAAQNRCRYCQLAHETFGRAAGLSADEIREILDARGDGPGATSPAEGLALAFARDLARRGFASRDERLWDALLEHYSEAEREAIHSAARVMNFANRFGNTFDAARARLSGRCDETGAGPLDLAVVSALFVPAALLVTPVVAALRLLVR